MVIIIQISEQYLKMVVVRQGGGAQSVAAFSEVVGSWSEAQISGKIHEMIKKLKLRPRRVILSLARNSITARNLHLPSQGKDEIAQMVDLNIVRSVPYKREDIVFGYRTLGLDDAGYTRAILAIVKLDLVRRLVGIVENAGLTIDRIVLGSYGVWKKVRSQLGSGVSSEDLCLALDVDDDFTDFIIFSKEQLYFSRSINMGTHLLAEQGHAGTDKFVAEVRQFLMMFYNEEINKKPVKILLCGAKAGQVLRAGIEAELGMTVEVVEDTLRDIPENVSLAGLTVPDPRKDDEIDFVLPEMQIRKALSQTTRDLVILGGLCIYILTMICGFYWGRSYNQENYLNRLNQTVVETDKDLGDLPDKLKKVEFIAGYLEQRQVPLFILAQLQRATPQKVALTSVTVDEKGRVVLRGQSVEISDVFRFIDNLDQAGYFKDVQTRSTKKKRVKDRDLIEFELSFIFS